MSNLNILEGGQANFGSVTRSIEGTVQNVTFSASEGTSSAVGSNTHEVRLSPDATCRILIGATVSASTGVRVIANTAEWFHVAPGDVVHVIAE